MHFPASQCKCLKVAIYETNISQPIRGRVRILLPVQGGLHAPMNRGKLPQTFTCEKDRDLSIQRKRKCKTVVLHRRKTVRQLSCTCLTRKSLYLSVNCRLGNSSHTDFVLQNPLSCFHPERAIFDEFLSSPDWFIERKHSKSRKDKIRIRGIVLPV